MLDNKTLKVYTYIIRQGKAFKTRKGTNMRETKNLLEQEILDEMRKRFPNADVTIRTVQKIKGDLRGITIREKNSNIAPTMYLDNYKYEGTIAEICDRLEKIYKNSRVAGNVDLDWFSNFDIAKTKLRIKLVNYENNKEYLADKPFVKILDLAAMFYIEVKNEQIENGSVTVLNNHMEYWKTSLDVIYANACMNEHAVIKDIVDIMYEMSGVKMPEALRGKQLVVSNEERLFGAGTFIAELDRLKRLYGKFYVLPSSIHEVIVVPENKCPFSKAELTEQVMEVNKTEVSENEILSDHAYYFNGENLEV